MSDTQNAWFRSTSSLDEFLIAFLQLQSALSATKSQELTMQQIAMQLGSELAKADAEEALRAGQEQADMEFISGAQG